MTVLVDLEGVGRDEWLEHRRSGIGGSDAAAVFGLHPWVSPVALYFDKTGEYSDDRATEAMEWGLRLEPVVADAWAEKNGERIAQVKAILRHTEHAWMIVNLDRVVLGASGEWIAVLEVKTASGWTADDWDDGVPPYVVVQVQHQLAVTGLPVAYVACLVGGQKFVQATIRRDDEFIAALIVGERRFWDRVLERRPPPADGHASTTDVLKARWEDTLAEAIELGPDGRTLIWAHHEAAAALKLAKHTLDEADNRIRMALGENETATVEGRVVATWKPDRNGTRRLNVKELTA
jgi:putative phage-type endonuclease